MSKLLTFPNFLSKLEEFEKKHTSQCAKLIENGRQIFQSICHDINKEHLTNLMESFMNFVTLLTQCYTNSSEEKITLALNQVVLKEQNESQDLLLKNDIIKIVNNDLQCPICNEWLLKATSANCNHTFCEKCIKKWLKINNTCPVCRCSIVCTSTSLAIDNFLSNLCELFGGFAKERRESMRSSHLNQSENQTNNLSDEELFATELNAEITLTDSSASELSDSELSDDTTIHRSPEDYVRYIRGLGNSFLMTHPNEVCLLPSPRWSPTSVPRVPIVYSNLPHPNTVQLSPYPQSSVTPTTNHRVRNFLPTSSTTLVSPSANHILPASTTTTVSPPANQFQSEFVVNPSINHLRTNINVSSLTRPSLNLASSSTYNVSISSPRTRVRRHNCTQPNFEQSKKL